jgi:hypothetical protein
LVYLANQKSLASNAQLTLGRKALPTDASVLSEALIRDSKKLETFASKIQTLRFPKVVQGLPKSIGDLITVASYCSATPDEQKAKRLTDGSPAALQLYKTPGRRLEFVMEMIQRRANPTSSSPETIMDSNLESVLHGISAKSEALQEIILTGLSKPWSE